MRIPYIMLYVPAYIIFRYTVAVLQDKMLIQCMSMPRIFSACAYNFQCMTQCIIMLCGLHVGITLYMMWQHGAKQWSEMESHLKVKINPYDVNDDLLQKKLIG